MLTYPILNTMADRPGNARHVIGLGPSLPKNGISSNGNGMWGSGYTDTCLSLVAKTVSMNIRIVSS